jgi:hypothetical protein
MRLSRELGGGKSCALAEDLRLRKRISAEAICAVHTTHHLAAAKYTLETDCGTGRPLDFHPAHEVMARR